MVGFADEIPLGAGGHVAAKAPIGGRRESRVARRRNDDLGRAVEGTVFGIRGRQDKGDAHQDEDRNGSRRCPDGDTPRDQAAVSASRPVRGVVSADRHAETCGEEGDSARRAYEPRSAGREGAGRLPGPGRALSAAPPRQSTATVRLLAPGSVVRAITAGSQAGGRWNRVRRSAGESFCSSTNSAVDIDSVTATNIRVSLARPTIPAYELAAEDPMKTT